MRRYELMVILDPDLEERTVAPSLDQFLTVVTLRWRHRGEGRHLGTPPSRLRDREEDRGIYAVVDLQAEPDVVKELDRQLNLNEAVLRTKVIRPDQR
jgi:small subunit ribosomal protein S6